MWVWLWVFFSGIAVAAPDYVANLSELQRLEKSGRAFSKVLCGKSLPSTLALRQRCELYRRLVGELEADLEDRYRRAKTELAGPEVFPPHWLRSAKTYFKLIGKIPRPDRAETREVYRLVGRYRDKGRARETYLPITVLLVTESGGSRRLEVNLLNLHYPAPRLPASAGYSEYLMRVFHFADGKLKSAPLENTPDVNRLKNDPALREALRKWLLSADGTKDVRVPDQFLATKAVSVAPFGSLRVSNAPFTELFGDDPDLRSRVFALDGLSCTGCHQTKSNAGFHFLGESLPQSFISNRTMLPASAHFFSELAYRRQTNYVHRPLAGRTFAHPGALGDVCAETLGSPFGCIDDLVCRHWWKFSGDASRPTGYCEKKKAVFAGEPYLLGHWREPSPIRAGLTEVTSTDCFDWGPKLPPEIGFPAGMCVTSCADAASGSACGAVPELQKFTNCRRETGSLETCFAKATSEIALKSCDVDTPCRPDYICARNGKFKGARQGVCVPPYFLSQLNLTDHAF